jgi:glycosyltransferase involved in cell wall biosynthesis
LIRLHTLLDKSGRQAAECDTVFLEEATHCNTNAIMTDTQSGEQSTGELRKLRILLIGPSTTILGGTSVSFNHLQNALEADPGVIIEVLSSFGIRGSGWAAPVRLLALMFRIVLAARRCDVISFHSMPSALPYVGWFLGVAARVCGKPLIYRAFGGMYYDELSWPGRVVARIFMQRASVVLLQTQELMNRAADDGLRRVEWCPTARPMGNEPTSHRGTCRRFVFVGHLKTAKGLQYLTRAAEQLPDDASVDVYGPWYDLPKDTFDGCKRIRYMHVLPNHEVVPTLRQYDALVFPTFMIGEGHSGIILEAYAAGIPVICTRWKALPEIVEDGVSGLLIEPESDLAILQAMMCLYLDGDLYRRLIAGGQISRGRFSQERQAEHFLGICREMAAAYPS